MKVQSKSQRSKGHGEAGAALLIAIFALMLISVVAIALVVSTGTDSALAGNFRSSEAAYYASVAGLEEARGRLLWKNANFINQGSAFSNLFDPSGALPAWGLANVVYIINPNLALGETAGNILTQYPDTEYNGEFPNITLSNAVVYTVNSVSPAGPLSGPSYKWVRINAVTQQALHIDVNNSGIGQTDGVDLLYFDPAHVNPANPTQAAPSLVVGTPVPASPTPTSVQVLEITALAVLPNGSTRLLQYVVAPLVISPDPTDTNFPAALVLDAGAPGSPNSSLTFTPATGYPVVGNNPQGCTQQPTSVPPLGYTNNVGNIQSQATAAGTSASQVTLRQSWLTPTSLDGVMQDIVNSADVILGPPGTYFTGPGSNFTGDDVWNAAPAMASGTPMTVVVNGNLTLSGSFGSGQSGLGLLLVTGQLDYHPSASWNGIILVVGQGNVVLGGHHSNNGGITGSIFVAQTRDSAGALLGNFNASVQEQFTGGATGKGFVFNACSVQQSSGPLTYKVLSFHEIPLT